MLVSAYCLLFLSWCFSSLEFIVEWGNKVVIWDEMGKFSPFVPIAPRPKVPQILFVIQT